MGKDPSATNPTKRLVLKALTRTKSVLTTQITEPKISKHSGISGIPAGIAKMGVNGSIISIRKNGLLWLQLYTLLKKDIKHGA